MVNHRQLVKIGCTNIGIRLLGIGTTLKNTCRIQFIDLLVGNSKCCIGIQ